MDQVRVTFSLDRPVRTLAGGSLVVAAGMAVAQLLGYAYNLLVSRSLGPVGYGEVAALLGIVVVGSVPATALQVVVARRTATAVADDGPAAALRAFAPATLGLAALTGVGLCLLAMPLSALLHLTSPLDVVLSAAILAPFAVTSAAQGALQGTGRYLALSVVFAVTGVGRFAGGALGLAAGHSATAVLAGTAVGGVVTAALCALAVLGLGRAAAPSTPGGDRTGLVDRLTAELGHVMVAVGGLLALTNLDLLLARVVLPAHQAGLYAAGSLATKAVYWAPQFVAVSVFPRLTDPAVRQRLLPRALAVVSGIGLVATVLAAVAGGPLLRLLVGPAYDAVADQLWLFCLLGALLAVVQLLVSSGMAARDRRVALLVWAACGLEVLLVTVALHGSITQVVTAATVSAATLAVAAFAARR